MVGIFCFLFVTTGLDLVMPAPTVNETSNDFALVVKLEVFIDKTLLIKDFFNLNKTLIITAPRQFGKSSNLDMIRRFAEVQVNQVGELVDPKFSVNHGIFRDNNLKIYQDAEFFYKHFAQYPVIYLDFKNVKYVESCDQFIIDFKYMLQNTYGKFKYLLNSTALSAEEKHLYENNYSEKLGELDLNEVHLMECLPTLCRLLFKHFNKRPVILIDEYDSPINKAIYSAQSYDIDCIFHFYKYFMSALFVSNVFVECALINACSQLASVSVIDNKILCIPFLSDSNFSNYYGFTDDEVQTLAQRFNKTGDIDSIRAHYDGYNVQQSTTKIYNSFSVANYLYTGLFEDNWFAYGSVPDLGMFLQYYKIRLRVVGAIEGETIVSFIETPIKRNILTLRKILVRRKERVSEEEADLFMQYLTEHGYFCITRTTRKGKTVLKVPNREIRSELNRELYHPDSIKLRFPFVLDQKTLFVRNFLSLSKDGETFEEMTRNVNALYRDVSTPLNRKEFLGSLQMVFEESDEFKVIKKEYPIGDTRIGLFLISNNSTAFAMEINHYASKDTSALEGLKRILKKRLYNVFDEEMFRHQISKGKILISMYLDKVHEISTSSLVDSTNINDEILG